MELEGGTRRIAERAPDDFSLNALHYLHNQATTFINNFDAIPQIDTKLARDFLRGSPYQLNDVDEANLKAVELITPWKLGPS